MLTLLALLACRNADITVHPDSSDQLTGLEQEQFEGDDAGECRDGADNDRDGSFDCDDSECWGSSDCSHDTAGTVDTDGDDTGVEGDDTAAQVDSGDDTGVIDDTASGDTAPEITSPCADGSAELDMGDAAFCQWDEAADYANRSFPGREATAVCGSGWHVCTDVEWTDRNDGCDSTLAFQGILDASGSGGNTCQVVDDLDAASCGSDLVRDDDYAGSCHGTRSSGVWGMGSRVGPTYSGVFGVMCCL